MKHLQLIIGIVLTMGLTLVIVVTMAGRRGRQVEIDSNLPSAVEETVENMMLDKKYTINNYNEFIADLVSNLSINMDTNSDITIEVLNADKEKGLLSIKIIEEYTHPNGNRGKVECERTVILNKATIAAQETYTVKFFLKKDDIVNGRPYKTCRVCEGDAISLPVQPTSTDGTFSGWLDPNDYAADFSVPVTEDLIYYAAWN